MCIYSNSKLLGHIHIKSTKLNKIFKKN